MIEPSIDRQDLETWAGYLLDHSLGGITPEDRVMIKGERIGWPLMEVLERRVIEAGGGAGRLRGAAQQRPRPGVVGRHGAAGQFRPARAGPASGTAPATRA